MATIKNELGNQYGDLTVIALAPYKQNSRAIWTCQCKCGNIVDVRGDKLRNGSKTNCGQCQLKSHANDLTGQRFNRLLVVRPTDKRSNRNIIWECQCDCGNTHYARGKDLTTGKIQSCGCLSQELRHSRYDDLTGQRFNKLTVIKRVISPNNPNRYTWKCQCDCGNICYVSGNNLKNGQVSCGCIRSKGNQQISSFLQSHNIPYKSEYAISDLKTSKGGSPRFDFAILNSDNSINKLIEYQGEQHFRDDKGEFGYLQRKETDKLKYDYCKEHNIPLLIITYQEDIEEILTKEFLNNEI